MNDPSKYEQLAVYLVERLGADAVVIAVINGPFGDGCCRAERAVPRTTRAEIRRTLATSLRSIAALIEGN
jgi:hypothetical protein